MKIDESSPIGWTDLREGGRRAGESRGEQGREDDVGLGSLEERGRKGRKGWIVTIPHHTAQQDTAQQNTAEHSRQRTYDSNASYLKRVASTALTQLPSPALSAFSQPSSLQLSQLSSLSLALSSLH